MFIVYKEDEMDKELTREEKGQVAYCLVKSFVVEDLENIMVKGTVDPHDFSRGLSNRFKKTGLNVLQKIDFGDLEETSSFKSEIGKILFDLSKIDGCQIDLFSKNLTLKMWNDTVGNIGGLAISPENIDKLSDEDTYTIACAVLIIIIINIVTNMMSEFSEVTEILDPMKNREGLVERFEDIWEEECLPKSIGRESSLAFFNSLYEEVYLLISLDGEDMH